MGSTAELSSLHPSLALRRALSTRRVLASTHFSCPARVPSVWIALGTPELYIPVLQLSYQSTLSAGTFRTTQHMPSSSPSISPEQPQHGVPYDP